MYIEEVIVDGFKSYASRTVVSGFDPSFNAITGLNGSGKSNILDSICFVLGISNLSQVRVGNLQELVYKGGQAGISKATVSIIFNNNDRSNSPAGYEDCDKITVTRQIVIGGRNKYLINGHVAQPGRVQNLFHSVQLNVNNPHFLIMQGRITKVISMKPPEVLAMIEEAAGTRMYELKKETALKTIEKKQRKVEEIEQVLASEITPMLDGLRKDRASYMKWCSNNTKIERLSRFTIAYDYSCAYTKASDYEQQHQSLLEAVESTLTRKKDIESKAKQVSDDLENAQRIREAQMSKNYRKLSHEVENLSKTLVKKSSGFDNQRDSLETEKSNLIGLKAQVSADRLELEKNESEYKEIQSEISRLELDVQKSTKEEANAQRALLTGSGGGNGSSDGALGSSVVDQIQAAKKGILSAETEVETLKMRASHVQGEYKAKLSSLKKDQVAVESMRQEQSRSEKAVQQVKLKLHELDYSVELAERLASQKEVDVASLQKVQDEYDELSARLSSFEFKYSNPTSHFDKSSVKGTVASLLTVRNPIHSTAIEVAAGGRLYQVVVDSDRTGKALLEKGKLQRRVTIIPLNKINASTASDEQMRSAQRVDPNVKLALSLVGHDDDVEAAIKYVFGRTMVCEDMDTAKRVTFDPKVRCRTVTLDGDIFDPAGTLSGGGNSRSSGPSVLDQLSDLNNLRSRLNKLQKSLRKVNSEIEELDAKRKRHEKLRSELELRSHEATLIEKKLESSSVGRLLKEVSELERQVKEEIPQALEAAKKQKVDFQSRASELEKSMSDVVEARNKAMKDAEKSLEETKDRLKSATLKLRERKEALEGRHVRMNTLREEISGLEEQVVAQEHLVSKSQTDVEAAEADLNEIRRDYEHLKVALDKEVEKLAENDSTIGALKTTEAKLTREIEEVGLEHKRLEHKQKSLLHEQKHQEQMLENLEKANPWILNERDHFGEEGGEYDFNISDPREAKKQQQAIATEQQNLHKRINKKVMAMFEKAEQEYQDLTSKRRIIETDKRKMESVIAELDEKKKEALQETWKKVNRDFASIFSTLLPGATAKLEPQEGCTVMDGLEIRVGFGSVWKDSLSELSGGQRSLIALSLVLAMLQFKPAPMYILDEVDAALDLSHTQNIGNILKTHFSHSQFIVVSLKEGMFNNANVIFRTKFVDGVSTVIRTVNRPLKSIENSNQEQPSKRRTRAIPAVGKENV